MTPGPACSPEELAALPLFEGIPEDVLRFLVQHATVTELEAGESFIREGDAAESMFVVLSGSLEVHFRAGGQEQLFDTLGPGRASGRLPFSRLTRYEGRLTARVPARVWRLHRDHFPELLRRSPSLGQRLVAIMSDRVRDSTRSQDQREKMMALGKLAAGLAHEVNNPAAAIRRNAADLGKHLESLSGLLREILEKGGRLPDLQALARARDAGRGRLPRPTLTALARSEGEDELAGWLEDRGLERPDLAAEVFFESGLERSDLEALAAAVAPSALRPLLGWLATSLDAERTTAQIAASAGRIAELVSSVKSYSHLDRATVTEAVDVRRGLDDTLAMLGHELKAKSIRVVRRYAPDLPAVTAHAGELNQVWTNLIDNAIDALAEGGELSIEAVHEGEEVTVRVIDDGPGIPPEIRPRLFEPFFTTKGVGEGTGLGLDIARRIVQQQAGQVGFESRPGRTVFWVRLPTEGPPASDRQRTQGAS